MSNIKNEKSVTEHLSEVAQHAGVVLMTAAATLGMVDLQSHGQARLVLPSQPAMALASESQELNNPLRREKEEVEQHYISYSVAQRTPARSGKR